MDSSKFTEATLKALETAINLAKENSNSQLSPAHLASALLSPTQNASGATQTTLFSSILNKGELSLFIFLSFLLILPHTCPETD